MLKSREDVLFYTQQLVQINSVVNTDGERTIAETLYTLLSSFPYFQAHKNNIVKQRTIQDFRERYNVIAYVKGTKKACSDTVVLLGHMDTVDIDDYGRLQEDACSPDKLMALLQEEDVPQQVKDHLHSNDWMFGRGVLDMKSGVAGQIYLLKYFSEHPQELAGNLVFIAVCDEEDGSHGMLSAIEQLNLWKQGHGFDYVAAINGEFVSPVYPDDPHRYIYKGTVGKLLPTFYISGAETHVGSVFSGMDPNFIAAEITRQIDYNPSLCDDANGESTVPPVSLKLSDLKPFYTVQTASGAYVYFNFFVHSLTPEQVLEKLREEAMQALRRTVSNFKQRHQEYCIRAGEPYAEKNWNIGLFTYQELQEHLVQKHGDPYLHHMKEFKQKLLQDEDLDVRQFSVRVVEEACKWMNSDQPFVVMFYSSLYSPAATLNGHNDKECKLEKALLQSMEEMQPMYPEPLKTRSYFPYISDMSFLQLKDGTDWQSMCRNHPGWGSKHSVNYESIRKLNIPFVNVGPYGMDAHNKYERMEMRYSAEIVPNLNYRIIRKLLD